MIAVIESEEDLASLVPDYDAMRCVEGRGLIITGNAVLFMQGEIPFDL